MTGTDAAKAIESVERVQVAQFAPDDVVVVTLNEKHFSAEACARVSQLLRETFPSNRVVVIASGTTIQALRPEQVPA